MLCGEARNSQQRGLPLAERDRVLGWIERQFPWVFVGYAAETEQQFKKQRRRLIEQVAARRREAEAPAPARPLTPSLSESANS